MNSQIFQRLLERNLTARVFRSASWTTLGFSIGYLIRLASTLILTRLLSPEVFGQMALATVFLMGIKTLSEVGVSASVIRSKRGDEAVFLRTAWTVQCLRGLIIFLVTCLMAWPISAIYDQPILLPLLCTLALSAILEGVTSISLVHCRRKLNMSKITLVDLISQLAATIISIFAAWQLETVWALAIGSLAGSFVRVVASFLILPRFSHYFFLEESSLKEIVSFGRWILLASLLAFAGGKGSKAIMGTLVGIETLGMIALATTLAWAMGDLVKRVLNSSILPSLSEINRNRPNDLPQAIRKVKLTITLLVLPVFVILSVISQNLVDLMYEQRYSDVGRYLALFSLNGAISTISLTYQNLMLAHGDGKQYAKVTFATSAIRISGLLLGFHLMGVPGMIFGIGIGASIIVLICSIWAYKKGFSALQYDFPPLLVILAIYVFTYIGVSIS